MCTLEAKLFCQSLSDLDLTTRVEAYIPFVMSCTNWLQWVSFPNLCSVWIVKRGLYAHCLSSPSKIAFGNQACTAWNASLKSVSSLLSPSRKERHTCPLSLISPLFPESAHQIKSYSETLNSISRHRASECLSKHYHPYYNRQSHSHTRTTGACSNHPITSPLWTLKKIEKGTGVDKNIWFLVRFLISHNVYVGATCRLTHCLVI